MTPARHTRGRVGKRAATRKELQAKAYLRELKAKLAEKDRIIAGITATNTAMSATVEQSQTALVEAKARIVQLETDIATTTDKWRDRALAAEGALGRADLDRERAVLDLQFSDLRIRDLILEHSRGAMSAADIVAKLALTEQNAALYASLANQTPGQGMQS